MAKTYRTIQQLDLWLNGSLGINVLEFEKRFFSTLFTQYLAGQVLIIGARSHKVLFADTIVPNRLLLGPLLSHQQYKNVRAIESELHDLPIASGSVDLVVLPHVLECLDNPRQLLAEACRVVRPQGHIIICGFNPWSLWGIKNFISNKSTPWPGKAIGWHKIKSWLALADFELVKQQKFLYRPPISHKGSFQRVEFIERLGEKCFPALGGAYLLVAQAKVFPLTPIKLRWKQKLSDVRLASIGVPRPTIRNRS